MRTDGAVLIAEYAAAEIRMLRTSLKGFFDFLDVALETIEVLANA